MLDHSTLEAVKISYGSIQLANIFDIHTPSVDDII